MIRLFCDGGVIGKNPSTEGGTWAWCIVDEQDALLYSSNGTISPAEMGTARVTNNQTELLAMVRGLQVLRSDEPVWILSDSSVTLGRMFHDFQWKNIPAWLKHEAAQEINNRGGLVAMARRGYKYTLLDGHPTRAELALGTGRRGHPVSPWNVWCDHACHRAAMGQTSVYKKPHPAFLGTPGA